MNKEFIFIKRGGEKEKSFQRHVGKMGRGAGIEAAPLGKQGNSI